MRILQEGERTNKTDSSRKPSLAMSEVVEDQGRRALWDAVFHAVFEDGSPQTVRRLIADGADVNTKHLIHYEAHLPSDHPQQTRVWWTPLMAASRWGHKEMVQVLIEAGADLEEQDEQGYTALILAVAKEHPRIVR